MNLDNYVESARTKILVYGPPKSGKTALVGKLAEHYNLFWLDLESGIKTLLNPLMLDPKFRKNIQVFNIPDHRLYPIAIDTVRGIFKGGLKKICSAHGKIACPQCLKLGAEGSSEIDISKFTDNDILVIDSLSQLASSAINKATFKEISKPDGEEYKATFHDYAMQGALMGQVLSLIQVIDLNVVAISHEVDVEKSETKEKIVPIAGTRNFSATCAKFFDSVAYCTIVNKTHRVFFDSTYSPSVVTGSRLPVTSSGGKDGASSLLELFKAGKAASDPGAPDLATKPEAATVTKPTAVTRPTLTPFGRS